MFNKADKTRRNRDGITLFDPSDFAGMHAAGALASQILDEIGVHVYPGQTTAVLDKFIQDQVEAAGAISATIGYKGYQHASCISINLSLIHI